MTPPPDFEPMPTDGLALHEGPTCDHCGGEALMPDDDGAVFEGDADACESCGFPGSVTVDEDGSAYWKVSELPGQTCDRDDCEECGTYAGEHFGPRR